MSAQIIDLSDFRAGREDDLDIDLHTAVDVAIRDLADIRDHWGTEAALERLIECQDLLREAFARS